MLLLFKIQAQLHVKGRNEVVVVVDGVKDLHHEHSLAHTNIYDYHSRSMKAQIIFKLLTLVGYSSTFITIL